MITDAIRRIDATSDDHKRECAKKVQHHLLESVLALNGYNYMTDDRDKTFVTATRVIEKLMEIIDKDMGWSMKEICQYAEEWGRKT
jgi:hypothetical protein